MLEAMIAHELAHIRRHDLWINLLQRVIETLLFYHPAIWWVSGRMRLERELCCDDLAVRATGRRADYADALVELSRTLHGWTAPILTAGMFTSRLSLPTRVRRILQVPSAAHDPNRGRYWIAGPLTLLLAGSMVLMAAIHNGVAQPAPMPAESPATQPAKPESADSTSPASDRWSFPGKEITLNWQNTTLQEAAQQIGDMAGLSVIASQVSTGELTSKTITFKSPRPLTFNQALTILNLLAFDLNYWMVAREDYMVIRPLSAWYRNIPPAHPHLNLSGQALGEGRTCWVRRAQSLSRKGGLQGRVRSRPPRRQKPGRVRRSPVRATGFSPGRQALGLQWFTTARSPVRGDRDCRAPADLYRP
jgi:hypothetical protein